MSYSFNPMSDEELEASDIVLPGIYNFEVIKAKRKTSKSGNDMAELQLKIWDNDGKIHTVFDYLVFSNIPLNIKKVSHFSRAVGLYEAYKKGSLPEQLENFNGRLELGIQDAQPNPNGGTFAKKNVVIDYIKNTQPPLKMEEFKDDDEIPF